MKPDIVEIKVYDKREFLTARIFVEQLSENIFRTTANELFNCDLTFGTEFETRINKEGKHEIIRITKKPEFITKKFLLSSQFQESEYRILGNEIIKQGGFWQVDFGNIAIINLPKDSTLNLDEIFQIFGFTPTELKD
jgi:hypothetical protein